MAEKILLVDDDSNILDGYRRSLSREFVMETALGGQQALKLTAENGPYAVVVSDMRMPGMDGLQLLSSIKAQSPDTIRIMLTGNADMDTAIKPSTRATSFVFTPSPAARKGWQKP
jgi:DNA-binding NtrC family response regulator